MQQGGGERGSPQSQYGVPHQQQGDTPITAPTAAALATHMQQQQVVEEASPISSRPPATASGVMNLDEFMRLSGSGGAEEDSGAGEDADRTGGIASGNRWPRQETLALLQIRSEMDATFRDATLKGPLWEDVSRKLAEMGFKRNAKKCKEKFENVHKYYKRTKEGRAGRQDGKSYRFFSQLEALHNTTGSGGASASLINLSGGAAPQQIATPSTSSLDVAPVSVGIPMPMSSSVRIPPPSSQALQPASNIGSMFPPDLGATAATAAAPPAAGAGLVGISFSSNGSSSSPSSEDDDDEDEELLGGQPSATAAGTSRKRKRAALSSKGETHRMMEFFEGLMKQVMQKQEAMQQRFLEAIEKREQDRMIRDEAWKRQEMARLNREHEIMAQERAISASRDAAIVAFLQKITGQTIHLPTPVSMAPPFSLPPPPPQLPEPVQVTPLATVSTQPPPTQPQTIPRPQVTPQQPQPLPQQQQHQQGHRQHQLPISSDIVMAVPEQQRAPQEIGSGGGSGSEPASSRWPKPEVLALIKLRSGLETRYQEAGPKGPLWEEISAGMQRMGYKRSAKRCKEKWENINKYFKKVKESHKNRPEDAKTCPYFHELDALYRKKILGGGGGGGSTSTSGFDTQSRPQEQLQQQQQQQESLKLDPMPLPMQQPRQQTQATESQNKNGAGGVIQASNIGLSGGLLGEGNGGASKPEDIVKELKKQQGTQIQQQQQNQHHFAQSKESLEFSECLIPGFHNATFHPEDSSSDFNDGGNE
ncbi:hypothetical protein SADUNF_Sadunf11G0109200 [Salix dunnii]|uniref:Myb-like domain-containing protein n=1 Tax=Salix dunnii TaxID=1413687 RepID=A0A835MTP2_9ROSI|nr:hypothetical protein SADUNF_Sadunf11G0109200 [Salix dunnii]